MKEFTDEQIEAANDLIDGDYKLDAATESMTALIGQTMGCLRREGESLNSYKLRLMEARRVHRDGFKPLLEAIAEAEKP